MSRHPHPKTKYFADQDEDETVAYLKQKGDSWFESLNHNRYLEKIKQSWLYYHGQYYDQSHSITFGGDSGELVNLPINHYRNIANHIVTMVTSTRPAFQPKSINTDYKTQVQTTLASGLLDYYMRDKRLEKHLKKSVEYAAVLGAGYIKMEWNATSGEIYDYLEPDEDEVSEYDEEGNALDEEGNILNPFPVYEGDVQFRNLSPFDVVFDNTKETSEEHDWVLTRTFKNKYDLAAKFPEQADKIKGMRTKSDHQRYRISLSPLDETDDVPVYEFFHKRTESLPNGRYIMYLDTDCILMDTNMPYRRLPVYRISPSDILGTPFGYTPMFDLIPMQSALNSLYSTILTNQNAFGVQNILNPRGNDVRLNQVEGGLNFIEYNPQFGKPEAMNLTQTPAEIFNFAQLLERNMETISGVNSVARGNPEASLKSGNALALVQSQALQFMNHLQQSYIMMIEDIGTGLIEILQDFAKVPRIAEIAGISNKTKMKEFTGDDLDSIRRVVVDVGNALAQCLGKDTPVMMSDGSFKMVQDIKIGDEVMGPDSEKRTVDNVNTGQEEMFRIKPKDKKLDTEFVCNKSHILTLRYCSDDSRYNVKKGDILDISVKDYLELPERHRRLLQGFTTNCINFDKKDVVVPPYILGAWLGDGTSACSALTTMDKEIELEWSNYAYSINMQIREVETKNKSTTYYITSGKANGKSDRNVLMNELKSMEVINNKHIPYVYLKNNEITRLELLAGLIDTDGSLVDQTFVFTQKSERLTNDVEYLAKSLGFKVTKKLIEREFNGKEANIYRLNIGGDTWRIPTRLPRKQVKKVEKQKNWNNFGIKVESLGQGTYYGFTLNEEPHFVLGNFVVTHNTTAGRTQMADNLIQMGLIQTPEDYMAVINTGSLDRMTEAPMNHTLLVKAENERLAEGTDVVATAIDKHSYHIREHMSILADPDLRLDPELVARVLAHIQEHIDLSRETDPDLLTMIGEQPLSPPQGTPIAPGTAGPPPVNQQGGPQNAEMMEVPQAQTTAPQSQTGLPEPAQAPMGPDGQPLLPSERPPTSG